MIFFLRYLIFFDIGYAQYSDLSNIHLILDASKNVWEDVPPDARTFIQKYFESPDRPMVKLNKAQFVKVEYNGEEICVIDKIFFEQFNCC